MCWCIELINGFQTLAPFLILSAVFACVLMFTRAYYLSRIYVGGVVFWAGWLFPDGWGFCAVFLGECLFRSCPFRVRLLFTILSRCVFQKVWRLTYPSAFFSVFPTFGSLSCFELNWNIMWVGPLYLSVYRKPFVPALCVEKTVFPLNGLGKNLLAINLRLYFWTLNSILWNWLPNFWVSYMFTSVNFELQSEALIFSNYYTYS